MSIVETFHGYIETTQDALLIFEACRRNILPKIARRLLEKERKSVRSGSVFVFDEKESGIKRWTDGLVWSPSRILGNFLIYRELNKAQSKKSNNNIIKRQQVPYVQPYNVETARQRTKERQLVGSLSEAYHFRKDGLIKKTISLVLNGNPLHLVSYYHPDDVLDHQLRSPSVVPELVNLEISPDLLNIQNFRIPPVIEPEQQQQHHHHHHHPSYINDTAYKNATSIMPPIQYNHSPPEVGIRFNHHHLHLEQQQKDAVFGPMHNALPSPTSTPNTPSQSNNERKYDPKSSIHSLLISPTSQADQIPQRPHHSLISDNPRMFNPVVQWNAL